MFFRRIMTVVLIYFNIDVSLFSQNFSCEKTTPYIEPNDIFCVYKDFSSLINKSNVLIEIEYLKKDTFTVLRITESPDIFPIALRKPDCFFVDNFNVIYIYSENYSRSKDTLWLGNLLAESQKILKNVEIKFCWDKDSIISYKFQFGREEVLDHDPILEYYVYKGNILKKNYIDEFMYPYKVSKGIKEAIRTKK